MRSSIIASCDFIRPTLAHGITALTDVRGNDRVTIHSDGACSGNPGLCGWGVILQWGDRTRELKGGEAHTTNNRMELMAAIVALETLKRPCDVDPHTDSEYLRQGITDWISGWKRNGWRTTARKPVKNSDLWQRLDAAGGPPPRSGFLGGFLAGEAPKAHPPTPSPPEPRGPPPPSDPTPHPKLSSAY